MSTCWVALPRGSSYVTVGLHCVCVMPLVWELPLYGYRYCSEARGQALCTEAQQQPHEGRAIEILDRMLSKLAAMCLRWVISQFSGSQ